MTQAVFNYENPFRPVYEYYAVYAWIAGALLAGLAVLVTSFPVDVFIGFAAFCALMAGIRGISLVRLVRLQNAVTGQKLAFMTRKQLRSIVDEHHKTAKGQHLFLGYGFTWSQEQAQLVHTIVRADPNKLIPPQDEQMGQTWIHGIGCLQEQPIFIPLDHTAGHMLLVGTTRAGKTRFLDTIIAQAIARGESTFVFDPKGDRDLKNAMLNACIDAGRESDFIFFHPAFPEISARIDPLANFSRATELATRIASLIPSETGADPFTAHSQMVLTNLCEGMLMINQKPTIKSLKHYVDSGPEGLVVKACEAYFSKHIPDWRGQAEPYLQKLKSRNNRELAIAYINFYREVVAADFQHTGLEGLFGDFEHDKSHQSKMTASLTPVLTMLTAGTLGELLSPDPRKEDDRPITDFARIIRNGQVCYVGLDSLSDNMVGSAIGSMFVSDMTAVSGNRYNYGDLEKLPAVNLVIDEAAELVSDKMIQLLNKAGGAKFRLVVATQTFADFAARIGSTEKARQVLGNLNNVIALRIIDGDTQEYVTESLPQTYVRHIEYTQATDTRTGNLLDFGYKMTEAMKETEVPLVQPPMFGCLPNLEFYARLSAGRVYKGRIPILKD